MRARALYTKLAWRKVSINIIISHPLKEKPKQHNIHKTSERDRDEHD